MEALQKNELAKESLLFIFSDGPKNADDSEKVGKVRTYIKTITGFKDIQIEESQENRGLADSVIAGVTKIVNQFGKVIVLEDDLVTSPYFLLYMNQALSLYENDDKVASVSGYSYNPPGIQNETFFLVGQECLGWGTWKRAWAFFQPDTDILLGKICASPFRRNLFAPKGFQLFDLLCAQRFGHVSSWAVRWEYSIILENKLTLYPRERLITHIGYEGTHVRLSQQKKEFLSRKKIEVERIPLKCNEVLLDEYRQIMKKEYPDSFTKKVKRILRFLFLRIFCSKK